MQHQSPSTNNPANPLWKVAALQLERIYPDERNPDVFRLEASLNFKKSTDMRGDARLITGEPISVSFTLAIRNATFQVEVSSDVDLKKGDLIKLSKVPFIQSLAVAATVQDAATATTTLERQAGASAQIDPSKLLTDPIAAAGASGRLKVNNSRNQSNKRKVSLTRDATNVAATFTNNIAHWEIKSSASLELQDPGSHLAGEVFAGRNGKPIDACRVTRKKGGPPLVAEGSVYLTADDLILTDLRFVDTNGEDVEVNRIEGGPKNWFWHHQKTAKERLLRQIIRKHLASNGMRIHGAKIEICRAVA